tara:strand:+ start:10226 stop:11338 length:1113 start_codon:yes stop_codon:yes gene_type:complete
MYSSLLFGEICTLVKDKVRVDDPAMKCIELEHIESNAHKVTGFTSTNETKSQKTKFEKDDVLFGKCRPYLRKSWLATFDAACSTEIWALRANPRWIAPEFLHFIIQSERFSQHANITSGTKMPRADWKHVKEFPVTVPSLEEQRRIAGILSTWEKAINAYDRLIALKEKQRAGIISMLIDGDAVTGEIRSFGDLVMQHKEKTTENNQYPVLTSSRNGIMLQSDYYSNGNVASKDNTGYNVVPRGFFTYRHMSDDLVFKFNINNICDKGIVSTLYPVFSAKEGVVNSHWLKLILNHGQDFMRYSAAQKQGGSRTYMYFKSLSKLKIRVPGISYQNRVSDLISVWDGEIKALEKKRDLLKKQKQGLMQQLLA